MSAVQNQEPKLGPVVVRITREAFMPYFTLYVELGDGAGSSEELDPEEARQWFKDRGASTDGVEKALDHAWNLGGFRKPIRVTIRNYQRPQVFNSRMTPRV